MSPFQRVSFVASPAPRLAQGAFTLVEVILVTLVTAILAVLLVPTIGGARERASTIECAGQLRQVGHAIAQYASENGGLLPGPLWTAQAPLASRDNQNVVWLGGYLAPYLGVNLPNGVTTTFVTVPAMFCPVNQRNKVPRGTSMWTVNDTINMEGSIRSPFGHPTRNPTPLRAFSVANPGSTWALRERDQGTPLAVVHRLARNTLFFDWHVESVRVP